MFPYFVLHEVSSAVDGAMIDGKARDARGQQAREEPLAIIRPMIREMRDWIPKDSEPFLDFRFYMASSRTVGPCLLLCTRLA